MPTERICGCKGIRTCLLCEKETDTSVVTFQTKEVKCVYTYCPHCNLCWPDDEDSAPLYLGKLKLFLEFISEDEEVCVISDIDRIPWMPSQSGRRKQDFGPKVNFKKKKVKIGEFKGFPKFTERILHRFQNLPELTDFQPVELCHLEYSPERGASIDPHVDDFWLWGERLVTINLGSPTVLTLAPCADGLCECYQESNDMSQLCTCVGGRRNECFLCDHKFCNISLTECSLKSLSINDTTGFKDDASNSNFHPAQNSEENECQDDPEKLVLHGYQHIIADTIPSEAGLQSQTSTGQPTECCKVTDRRIETMCSLFRTRNCESKAVISIVLPPRSLLVLAGCARYNWSHEIKRRDVVSRRLAMTFRELTAEFLDGGRKSQLGEELLLAANKFCDL